MSESNEHKKQSSDGYSDHIIEGHSYDGIVEYDNPMPLWWKAIFVVTIIWSPIYILAMETGFINTYQESLHEEDVYWSDIKEQYRKSQPELTPERIQEEVKKPERIDTGAKVFATNCASCHGDKGEGLIGPNLTDKFWLHGGGVLEIYHTIDQGILDKGMPAWGSVLSPDDMLNVEAFILSIRNTNVPGKAPQGDPYVEDGEEGGDAAAEGGEGAEGAAEGAEGENAAAEGEGEAKEGDDAAKAEAGAEDSAEAKEGEPEEGDAAQAAGEEAKEEEAK